MRDLIRKSKSPRHLAIHQRHTDQQGHLLSNFDPSFHRYPSTSLRIRTYQTYRMSAPYLPRPQMHLHALIRGGDAAIHVDLRAE